VTVLLLAATGGLLFAEYNLSNNVDLSFFQINSVIGFVVAALRDHGNQGILMRTVVAITGASGGAVAVEFLKRCPGDKYLILSRWGKSVLHQETGLTPEDPRATCQSDFFIGRFFKRAVRLGLGGV
jgi:uncharacterized membrane protein YeaQ/YmgE (transglycosylase-associated protein family)